LVICLLSALRFFGATPVDVLTLGQEYPVILRGDQLTIWYHPLLKAARSVLVAVALLLPALTLGTVRIACRPAPTGGRLDRWIRRAWPLALLPLIVAARLLADLLPPACVTNFVFFLPLAVLAAVLAPGWKGAACETLPVARERRWNAGVLGVTCLFFYALGLDLALTSGEHVGDEGHYLTQMESLYVDHDLDIKNQIMDPALAETRPFSAAELERQHVAPKSRGGHWYSWHPYGLPLILAPLWPLGVGYRYLVLAFIAALGCLAMFRISRRVGASCRAGAVAVAGLGVSYYWAIYSARALPEVLGATLLVWVFWAIRAQADKPWRATLVAAACCAYMAPAHVRFLPLSLMGMGLFGLFGLFGREPWPAKLVRLSVFTVLCGAGYAAYFAVQQILFGGSVFVYGTVPVTQTLFSFPLGMWATIADVRGVVSVFPLLMWLGVALPVWILVDARGRFYAASLLLMVASCLLTSCTNVAGIGGACVPGRYFLVVIPLFIPAGAVMLDRASVWARGWFLFLALVSALLLLLMVLVLPNIGRSITLPTATLRVFSAWQGLFQPHASFLHTPINPDARMWATLYVLAGMAATAWLLLRPTLSRRAALGTLGVVLAVAVISHAIQTEYGPSQFQPGDVAQKLQDAGRNGVVIQRTRPAPSRLPGWWADDEVAALPADAPVRPPDDWRYVDPSAIATAVDAAGAACRDTLVDAVLETRWSAVTDPTNPPALTFAFKRPVALVGLRLVSSVDLYPQDVLLESQATEGASWVTLSQTMWLTDTFWSGRRLLPAGAQFVEELRCVPPPGGVRRLRVTFRPGRVSHVVCLSEMLFLEKAVVPGRDLPSSEACEAAIRDQGIKQFYGPRWVSDGLSHAMREDPALQVPALIPCTTGEWIRYDPKFPPPVMLREKTGFMVDVRDAERTRRVLRAAGLRWEERSLGALQLLVVPKPGPNDDTVGFTLMYWTEAGGFAVEAGRLASRKAQRLYEAALSLGRSPAAIPLLEQALERYPAHESARRALIKALQAKGRTGEANTQAAQLTALTVPDIPARIRYEGGIEFLGMALSARSVKPGDPLRVTYSWRCPPEGEFRRPMVFMHVRKGGTFAFQDDHLLLGDWLAEDLRDHPFDQILTEQREVVVPTTVAPGDYDLTIGLYYPEEKKRLEPDTDLPVRRRATRLPVVLRVGL
jgi:hypothetical protein